MAHNRLKAVILGATALAAGGDIAMVNTVDAVANTGAQISIDIADLAGVQLPQGVMQTADGSMFTTYGAASADGGRGGNGGTDPDGPGGTSDGDCGGCSPDPDPDPQGGENDREVCTAEITTNGQIVFSEGRRSVSEGARRLTNIGQRYGVYGEGQRILGQLRDKTAENSSLQSACMAACRDVANDFLVGGERGRCEGSFITTPTTTPRQPRQSKPVQPRRTTAPVTPVAPVAPRDYELAFAVCGGEQTAMKVSQSAEIRLGHVAQAAFNSTPSGFNVDRDVRTENGFDFTNEEAIAGFETPLTDCEYAAVVKLHDGSLRNDQPYEISDPAQVCYMPGNQGWTDGYREWALDTTGDVACPTQLPVEEPCDCNDGTAVTESGFLGGKNGIFAIAAIGALGALGIGTAAALGRRRLDTGPKAPTA